MCRRLHQRWACNPGIQKSSVDVCTGTLFSTNSGHGQRQDVEGGEGSEASHFTTRVSWESGTEQTSNKSRSQISTGKLYGPCRSRCVWCERALFVWQWHDHPSRLLAHAWEPTRASKEASKAQSTRCWCVRRKRFVFANTKVDTSCRLYLYCSVALPDAPWD